MNDKQTQQCPTGPGVEGACDIRIRSEAIEVHPALEPLTGMITGQAERYVGGFPFVGVYPPVVLFSAEDAETRGQPEHAGKLIVGHQRYFISLNKPKKLIQANYSELPDAMTVEEYVLRDFLKRMDTTLGQRAVAAALLAEHYAEAQAADSQAKPPREQAEEKAAEAAKLPLRMVRQAGQLLQEAPDLAEQIKVHKMSLDVAWTAHQRRQEKAADPAAVLRQNAEALQGILDGPSSGQLSQEEKQKALHLLEQMQSDIQASQVTGAKIPSEGATAADGSGAKP